MTARKKSILKGVLYLLAGMACFASPSIFAADPTGTGFTSGAIGTIANNVQSNFSALATLITSASYVMGFAFVLVAIFKFKQHKDAPTQITIGAPIAMLFIGAAMIFLPSVISTTGKTVFGSTTSAGGVAGTDTVSDATTAS